VPASHEDVYVANAVELVVENRIFDAPIVIHLGSEVEYEVLAGNNAIHKIFFPNITKDEGKFSLEICHVEVIRPVLWVAVVDNCHLCTLSDARSRDAAANEAKATDDEYVFSVEPVHVLRYLK
jgi:hypothetical protein